MPTFPSVKPIAKSLEAYVQRDLIRLQSSNDLRHSSCGIEVIGGNREVSFYPFHTLRDIFEKYPQHFDHDYPLEGFGPWRSPCVFRPFTRIPDERTGPLPRRLVAVRCDHTSLLYITSTHSCSALFFARHQDENPLQAEWQRLEGLVAGDIVSLAAGTVFATKALGSLLLSDEGGINMHLEQHQHATLPSGELIDESRVASLVTKPSKTGHVSDAKIFHTTIRGIDFDFIQLGESRALQVEYRVKSAYAMLATRGRNIHVSSHRAGGARNELELTDPPSGCIVRGGATLSISGLGSVLILSKQT